MTQKIIRIKIPAKIKKEMDEIKIDWNEYIYQCIPERLNSNIQSLFQRVLKNSKDVVYVSQC